MERGEQHKDARQKGDQQRTQGNIQRICVVVVVVARNRQSESYS